MTDVLTLAQIDDLLSNTRTRGEYKPVIGSFVESGELAFNLSNRFPGKTASAIKQSVNQNIEKHFADSDLKVVTVGEGDDAQAVLVNMRVHAAQTAEASKAASK